MSLFIGSRYTFWPIFLVAFAVSLPLIKKRKENILFFIPGFMMAILFTALSIRHQLGNELPYLSKLFLNQIGWRQLLRQVFNLLSLFLLSFPCYTFFINRESKDSLTLLRDKRSSLFLLRCLLTFLSLDFFSFSPFIWEQRYMLSLHSLALASILLFVAPLIEKAFAKWSIQSIMLFFIPAFLSLSFANFQRIYLNQASNILPLTSHLSTTLNANDRVYCDFHASTIMHFQKSVLGNAFVPDCLSPESLSSQNQQSGKSYLLRSSSNKKNKSKVILGGDYVELLQY